VSLGVGQSGEQYPERPEEDDPDTGDCDEAGFGLRRQSCGSNTPEGDYGEDFVDALERDNIRILVSHC
jgi:hypothetical protein